jgi:hypothetical protein
MTPTRVVRYARTRLRTPPRSKNWEDVDKETKEMELKLKHQILWEHKWQQRANVMACDLGTVWKATPVSNEHCYFGKGGSGKGERLRRFV